MYPEWSRESLWRRLTADEIVFWILMLLTQIYYPLASASKLEFLCVNDRIPARMEMTAYYVIRSNIPVDWIGHMISWLCMYFVIFPTKYVNRGDRLKLKLYVRWKYDWIVSIKQLIVYWLHWTWSRSDLLRCRRNWVYDLGKMRNQFRNATRLSKFN